MRRISPELTDSAQIALASFESIRASNMYQKVSEKDVSWFTAVYTAF